jgi:hypothetical protein
MYISNFTRARCYFLCVEFSDFYVNQSLAGQTIPIFFIETKKPGGEKNKMLSIELKIKFHRLLNALGSYIRKYKISNN